MCSLPRQSVNSIIVIAIERKGPFCFKAHSDSIFISNGSHFACFIADRESATMESPAPKALVPVYIGIAEVHPSSFVSIFVV